MQAQTNAKIIKVIHKGCSNDIIGGWPLITLLNVAYKAILEG
jgi:hypothetical protein